VQSDKLNKHLICSAITVLLFAASARAEEWREAKGEHFIVYSSKNSLSYSSQESELDSDFAEEVLDRAETYYRNIALDLGYPRYSEFWTWDKRVKIYIYPSHDAYLKASGHPSWSHGMAEYTTKTISSYAFSKDFLDTLLPHEMAHLIFRDFVGFKGEIPLWIDEGIAQWEEPLKRPEIKKMTNLLYENDSLLSISDMMRLDVRNIKEADRLYIRSTIGRQGSRGVLFLSSEKLIQTYYVQSASLVGFLIDKYGSTDFAHFCRQLRDGKSTEEALKAVYPLRFRSLDEFEENWRKYLTEGG
jgi:hypothetical protein